MLIPGSGYDSCGNPRCPPHESSTRAYRTKALCCRVFMQFLKVGACSARVIRRAVLCTVLVRTRQQSLCPPCERLEQHPSELDRASQTSANDSLGMLRLVGMLPNNESVVALTECCLGRVPQPGLGLGQSLL